jgi:signal transduction histidine kinase
LAQQLLAFEPEMVVGERVLRAFAGAFRTRALCVFEAETAKLHTVGRSHSHLPARTRAAYIQGQESDSPAIQVSVRLLCVSGKTIGAMGFEGLEDPEYTASPLASLGAAALEQACALRRASTAAAAAQADAYRLAILDTLANEFKNPLAIILAASCTIRATGPLRPEQVDMTRALEVEAARLGSRATRLLRIARLGCEEVRPRFEVIDIPGVVDRSQGQRPLNSVLDAGQEATVLRQTGGGDHAD